jgi:triacylglycerol lipase
MYFPKGFDGRLALELGELVNRAYGQFAAFEEEGPWSLPEGYVLRGVLDYSLKAEAAEEGKKHGFDLDLGRLFGVRRQASPSLPIGFVAQRKNKVFVIFRGTKTPKEWINNFSMGLKEYRLAGYGRVHEGFLHMYESARGGLMGALAGLGGGARIFVAGHSLGAALASLALPDIETTMNKKASALYTFGSPRLGDSGFVEAFNREFAGRSYRVVNTCDLVTSIPPPVPLGSLLGGFFSHVDCPVDFTTQKDDLEKNHAMATYLGALAEAGSRMGLLGRLFGWGNRG